MTAQEIKVGDRVRYYSYTDCVLLTGTVTKVDVDVERTVGKTSPKGVQIDGALTRPYCYNDKSRTEA